MSYVTKRNGTKEPVNFNKITERIARLVNPQELQSYEIPEINSEDDYLDPVKVAQKVITDLYSGISTQELDLQSAIICQNMSTVHPSYSKLGGRILVSNLHKNTLNNFSSKVKLLSETTEFMHPTFVSVVLSEAEKIDKIIDYNRDFLYDFFGFKTLEKSYLLRSNNKIVERPQDMLLRTAVGLNIDYTTKTINLDETKKLYELISLGYYTHASPTYYNIGTKTMQLSSCFLGGVPDNLKGISKSWDNCSQISKWAGGIGLSISDVREKNSIIKGTGGPSNGIIPLLKMYDQLARYVNQGGKRPGSIAIYLEPHHPDMIDFLNLRKNFGDDTQRARDLFTALWISDLFMKQVDADADWYLMKITECPNLSDTFGDEYETLYWKYVSEGKYREKISARKLWMAILESQIETGMPYIGFKDSVNKKSNQKNLGTIKNSNLCIEIVEYSNDKEYAVCNLGSISLKHFVVPYKYVNSDKWIIYSKPNCKYCVYAKKYLLSNKCRFQEIPFTENNLNSLREVLQVEKVSFPQIFLNQVDKESYVGGWDELYTKTASTFDYEKLYEVAYNATVNLNKVIDINYYPIPETKLSNMKHRPIGLGIQGLADALALMRIPFDSVSAVNFNSKLMETIYLASVSASNDLAKFRANEFVRFNELVKNNNINVLELPEFHDGEFNTECEEFNALYHKLKPNIYELTKLSGSLAGAYSSFSGSYFSEGKFQFDLWDTVPENISQWDKLRESVMKYGTRNSLLTALMPTASTSQILSNNECFEYFTNNIYTRNTQAGNFVLVNKYLVNDLLSIGMWNPEIKDKIIGANGSVQSIENIPDKIKNQYKTMWEIKQMWVLESARARSPYVDQTQSMNLFMGEPDYQRLTSSHFKGWKLGLKTGMYYLRTKPAADATKFTVDPRLIKESAVKMVKETPECENCSA
jgi:ribonucleoside-diphosphate reductase alpha subunit